MKRKPDLKWNKNVLNKSIPLHNLIKSTLEEWFKAKHRITSEEESFFLNSIYPETCPFCESEHIVKNGKNKYKIQRYKCLECGSYFTITTNTIFDSHKIPISEWIEYMIHLFEYHSLNSSSRDNRNAKSTGKYWILKIFEVLKNYQDSIVLSGDVYFDETFVLLKKSDREKLLKEHKAARICVGIATNKSNVLVLNEKVAKETTISTLKTFENKIVKNSVLIHDDNYSHLALIEKLNLKSIIYSVKKQKTYPNNQNPLEPINYIHFLYKTFLRSHGAFNRSDIDNWNNLFAFIVNPPINVYEKIAIFINLALNKRKLLRFRTTFCKKNQ